MDFASPSADAAAAPTHWALYSHSASSQAGDTLYATQRLAGNPGAPALGASFGFDAGALELAIAAPISVAAAGDIPGSPAEGDYLQFTAIVNLPAGFVDADGATAVAASAVGEWFVRTAANWRKLAHAGGAVTPLGVKRAFETGLVGGTTYMGVFAGQPSGADPGPIDDRAAIAAATWAENPAARQFVRNSAAIDYGVQASDVARPMWLGLFDSAKGGNLLWQDRLDVAPPDPNLGATLSIPMNAVGIGFAIDA